MSTDAVNDLLRCLNKFYPEIPSTKNNLLCENYTLKNQIRKFNPENELDSSEFIYIGVAEQLKKIVEETVHLSDTLFLQMNIDGFSSFKSSAKELWPILGKIFVPENNPFKPFAIAIYFGVGKPNSVKFICLIFLKNWTSF